MLRTFLLLVACLIIQPVMAQQYPLRNYTVNDGLCNDNVYRIYQDHLGFLWFCTDFGLSRFDGRNFTNYYKTDGLLGNCIMSLTEDDRNNKLVSCYNGGLSVMSDTGILSRPALPIRNLLYAAQFRNSTWLIVKTPIQSLFRLQHGRMVPFATGAAPHPLVFNKLVRYSDEILLPTNRGIYRLRDTVPRPFLHSLFPGNVVDVKRAANGDYWVGLEQQLYRVRNGAVIDSYRLRRRQPLNNILADRKGNVWISMTGDGLLLVKKDSLLDLSDRLKIPGTIINDLYEDHSGNIWIATYTNGIYQLRSLDILSYTTKDNNLGIYTTALCPVDSNRLLIGSIGRLHTWTNGKITPYHFGLLQPGDYINKIKLVGNRLLVATPYGLLIKDTLPPCRERIAQTAGETEAYGMLSVFQDSRGTTWAGGYDRLFRLVGDELIPCNDPVLPHKRYDVIYETADSTIWFGTDSGLISYRHHRYRRYYNRLGKDFNTIKDIYEDRYHRLWCATTAGLFSIQDGQVRSLVIRQNTRPAVCNMLAGDDRNKLWVATYGGLTSVDLGTLAIRNYSAGLFRKAALSLLFSNNRLFAGTTDGLSVVNTADMTQADEPPPVYITSIQTDKGISNMPSGIRLTWHHNKLTINFTAINYQNPQLVDFRYRIANLDNNWHLTRNTSIELPALPSGNYSFVLSARQNAGAWGHAISIPIYVSTPYWRQAWFLIPLILLCVAAIFFAARQYTLRRENAKRKQLQVYNKIAYLKQQAVSAMMNPHFIFNCMNSIQHYLNDHDNAMANAYLADFASLIRMTMEYSKEAFIKLGMEITRLKLYLSLEQLRIGEDLEYDIVIDPELNTGELYIPNMILQPYIENAIWHGIMPSERAGRVTIDFKKISAAELRIRITDNGIGMEPDQAPGRSPDHNSFGTGLTAQRLHLLQRLLHRHYSVHISGQKDKGTTVEIRLPIYTEPVDMTGIEERAFL